MARLTDAQKRVLKAVSEAAVELHFDVHGGYWWTERGWKMPAYGNGKTDMFPPLPIRYLERAGLIEQRATSRPYPGRHLTVYGLTPAGRAALAEER